MSVKLDTLPTLILLTQREHQRLTNKAKRFQTWALDLETLHEYRASCVEHLGYVDMLPPLLQAVDQLIYRERQGTAQEADYEAVVFQIDIYKKNAWAFIRRFYGSLNPYVDRWLKVLPSYKEAFARRYEAHSKLSVAEQGALMREMIDAVPNKDDPYRQRQHPESRAILEELGILDEARDREAKPANERTTGQVVDFQAFKKRYR